MMHRGNLGDPYEDYTEFECHMLLQIQQDDSHW